MSPIERGSPEWHERVAAFQVEQSVAILERGWTAVGVFPTDDSEGKYHFAYTTGRALAGDPELVVTGMSQNAGIVFELVVNEEWSRFAAVPVGTPVAMPEGGVIVLAPVPDAWRDANMGMTRSLIGDEFTALEIIWTDDDDRWPWDEGHARQERMAEEGDTMPILAGDDWRPLTEGPTP